MNKSTEATSNNQKVAELMSAAFALFGPFCVSNESDECSLPITYNGYRLFVAIEYDNDVAVRFGLGLQRGVHFFGGNKFEKELKKLFAQNNFTLTRSEQFATTFWFAGDRKMLVVLLQTLREMICVSLHSDNQLNTFSLFPNSQQTREKLITLHVSLGQLLQKNKMTVDSLFNLTTQFILDKLKTDPQFKSKVESKLSVLPNDIKEKYNRRALEQPLVLLQSQKIEQKAADQNQHPDNPCWCVLT